MNTRTVFNELIVVLLLWYSSFAKEHPRSGTGKISNTVVGQPYVLMNANNVTSWVHSDGFFNWLEYQSWNGEFPQSSGVGTIFSEGIVFGGIVSDGLYANPLRVNGDTYFVGMQPGAIHTDGSVDDANDINSRAFGVRPDMPPILFGDPTQWPDLTIDAATFFQKPQNTVTSSDKAQIASQYFADWTAWPAAKGAPWYIDSVKVVRNDAGFNPNNPHHIPGIPLAAKTIWFVCNDQNVGVSTSFAGSPPIGMEEQMTLWAYATSTPLSDVIFKQVKLIYKGNPGAPANSRIDSMYVVQWADPDDGDANDDFSGCDSSLSLNYVYNSKAMDSKYAAAGLASPAVGYSFMRGATRYTGIASDSAVVNFQMRKGYKYSFSRPMTAATYFASGSPIADPDNGNYSGTQQWFNLMRGCLPRPAYPAGIPFYKSSVYASNHSIVTPYVLSGDPITGAGWIDGIDLPGGDRRLVTVHGPITLNRQDTAEVVIALVNGLGSDNLSSVSVLKAQVGKARQFVVGGGPIAYIDPVKDVYSVGSTVQFKGSSLTQSGVAASTQWSVSQKPVSSSAQIVVANPTSSHIQVDVAGTYRIAFIATAGGMSDTAYVQFTIVNNTPPIAHFTGTPAPVTVGDTLYLDGTSTSDTDGDSLTYTWSIAGDYLGFDWASLPYDSTHSPLIHPHSVNAKYVPLRSCKIIVTLAVSDSFFTNKFVDSIVVSPIRTSNVQVTGVYSYTTNSLPSNPNSPFYYLGTFRVFPDNSVWVQSVGSYYPLNINDPGHPAQLYNPFYPGIGGNFSGGANVLAVSSGNYGVYVYGTDGSSSILNTVIINPSQYMFHTNADSLAYDVIYHSPYLFTSYGSLGFYVYDLSSTFSPILANHVATGQRWTSLTLDGSHLFSMDPIAKRILYADITNPSSISTQTIAVSSSYNARIKKLGEYFYLFKSDSVGIYDLSNLSSPILKSVISVPKTLNQGNTITDISGDGTTLMLGTTEGVYFYNVSDPSSPALVGKFIIGYSVSNVFFGSAGIVSYDWGRSLVGYEGINVYQFTIEGVTNPGSSALPESYALYQNYPNPFNPSTTLRYGLPARSHVRLRIYNILGQIVADLVNAEQDAGWNQVVWNPNFASGLYFYRLEAISVSDPSKRFVDVKKMILLK
jgi:hypothetical protein